MYSILSYKINSGENWWQLLTKKKKITEKFVLIKISFDLITFSPHETLFLLIDFCRTWQSDGLFLSFYFTKVINSYTTGAMKYQEDRPFLRCHVRNIWFSLDGMRVPDRCSPRLIQVPSSWSIICNLEINKLCYDTSSTCSRHHREIYHRLRLWNEESTRVMRFTGSKTGDIGLDTDAAGHSHSAIPARYISSPLSALSFLSLQIPVSKLGEKKQRFAFSSSRFQGQ